MHPTDLLRKRQSLTDDLRASPYDASLYLSRADCYAELGFPDLAAGDAYKALLLIDEYGDNTSEYHSHVYSTLAAKADHNGTLGSYVAMLTLRSYKCLAVNLQNCGCRRSAYDFCERCLFLNPRDSFMLNLKSRIVVEAQSSGSLFDPKELPARGSVRRELYAWNNHEPDRFSSESLAFLNSEMRSIAPKCAVLATDLPLLTEDGTTISDEVNTKQLGIFATEDIAPGETVLHETSILTANNRLLDPLCDACSLELPPISSGQTLFSCPECDDTVFCSETCLSIASDLYHPAVCGKDVEAIGKDTEPKEAADALYLLLLARVIALSATQDIHPLELKETKYIWGDFLHADGGYIHLDNASDFSIARHLPFSFTYNILSPLHILEKMDIDIFKELDRYDFWVLNTLYAKFRATASARLSTRDGRPEVSAVHPLWCLANHSCAPNVRWEWGGDIKFWARSGNEIVKWGPRKEDMNGMWQGGIRAGDEVLNHYCDPELDVKQRREWAVGALGGMCVCERCIWEDQGNRDGKK